jgi:tRNA(Ile)-lysidine synthase
MRRGTESGGLGTLIDHALPTPGRDQSRPYALRPYDLPGQLRFVCDGDEIVIERSGQGAPQAIFSASDIDILLPVPGSVPVQGTAWKATADVVEGDLLEEVRRALACGDWSEVWQLLPSSRYNVYIDGATIEGDDGLLRVRTRRAGDRIQPLGMMGEKKVQDVLVDLHIARTERATIPLFFSESHCIWLAGICLDERVKLTNSTQHVVLLSIEQEDDTKKRDERI